MCSVDELQQIKDMILGSDLASSTFPSCTVIGPIAGGTLRYVHKLFPPVIGVDERLAHILGWLPPTWYLRFLQFSNGAVLFDNTIFIYGVDVTLTRDLDVEAIRPPDLKGELRNWRQDSAGEENWAKVGAVAAYSITFPIRVSRDGQAAINDGGSKSRSFPTFSGLLLAIMRLTGIHCDADGISDLSSIALERELISFIAADS